MAPESRHPPRAALRHPHGRGHRRRHRPTGRRHQHRVAAAATCADRRRAGVGGGHGPDQRPHRRADQGPGDAEAPNISRPVHAYMRGRGKRPRSTPAIDSFQRRRPSIAVLPFVDQAAGRRRLVFQRRPGRGHHLGAVVPARVGRDLAHLDAALPRHGARSAADPPRPARALPAVGQRAAGRRQGPAVGRAGGLRERHHDLERPVRRRGGRSLRAAGRAFSPGGGDDRAAGAGGPSCAACCASGRRASTPTNACCAGSTCSTASRTTSTPRRCRCSSAPWRSIPAMRRRYALAATWHSVRIDQGTVARHAPPITRRPSGCPAGAHARPLRPAGAVAVRPCPRLACSATTTMPSSCSTARWRPTPARRSPGCAAAPPSATSARRARPAGAPISGCACRPTTPMSSSATRLAARGLRRRRLCRGGELGARIDGAQSALHRQPALPGGQPGRQWPDRGGAPGRRRTAAGQSQVQRRAVRRGACLQGSRKAAAVRRSSRAGGAAGVFWRALLRALRIHTLRRASPTSTGAGPLRRPCPCSPPWGRRRAAA